MNEKIVVGWRENLSLPTLGIKSIKAKVDTGAKTSCLHAFNIETFTKTVPYSCVKGTHSEHNLHKHLHNQHKEQWVRFWTHSGKHDVAFKHQCEAKIIDIRNVRDSGGHNEKRYVIQTEVKLGTSVWPIEITLTNRKKMAYSMLLGRTAMHDRIIVDPVKSYLIKENS